MKMIYNEKHHDIIEAANILCVSTATIRSYIKSGKLKAIKLGGKWHIKETTIKAFIDGDTSLFLTKKTCPARPRTGVGLI